MKSAAISSDIETVRGAINANLTYLDKTKADTERTETARMMKNCTALLGFEIVKGVYNPQTR